MSYQLRDFVTKEIVYPQNLIFTGEKNPWEVLLDLKKKLKNTPLSHFKDCPPKFIKYFPLMPIEKADHLVSLDEPATPLILSRRLKKSLSLDLFFKLEGKLTTGSFKDRGSIVDVSVALELGAKAIVVASTGNMAASLACYSKIVGLPCFIFVPERVPMSKLAQVVAFGGKIIQVLGTYAEVVQLAKRVAKKMNFFLAGDSCF